MPGVSMRKGVQIGYGQRVLSPRDIANLAAWYDISDGASLLNNSGVTPTSGQSIKLISDKSGNSAVNCLCLPGVASNFASAPDSTALSITGSIDLRADVAFDSWTPATNQMVISKLATSGQFSYDFFVTATTGVFTFRYSPDGTTVRTANSSVGSGLAAFSRRWIRATYNSATGDVQFFTSTDGTTWVQLGTTVSLTAGSIFDGNTGVGIGANTGGSDFATGRIYRAQIYNGIGGSLAFDANFALASKLSTSFTESSSNAATVTIDSSGDLGARISGERDLVQLTASKQPIYLPWSGVNYGWTFAGTGTGYFSTPDSAAVSATSEIDIKWFGRLADYTPSVQQVFVAKWFTAGQVSYFFDLTPGGNLRLFVSSDGTASAFATSSAGNTFTDNTDAGFRVTWRASDGATTFYTSTDGVSWSQLGTVRTLSSGVNIFDGTSILTIGLTNTSAATLQGRTYWASISKTIDGTPAAIFNPAPYTSGTTFTASTGEVWTLNGGATIVNRTSLYFDGSDDYMKAAAFSLSQPETVYFTGQQVSWTSLDNLFDGGAVGEMSVEQVTASPQIRQRTSADVLATTSNFALATSGVLSCVYNGASSGFRVNRLAATTGTLGAAAANGFTLGSRSDAIRLANIRASEVILYAAAHDLLVQNLIITYLGAKWKINVNP